MQALALDPHSLILISDAEKCITQQLSNQLLSEGLGVSETLPCQAVETFKHFGSDSYFIYLGSFASSQPLAALAQDYPLMLIITDPVSETIDWQQFFQFGFSGCTRIEYAAPMKSLLTNGLLHFKALQQIKAELAETRARLEDRKQIERAKGLLMIQHQCNESQAYNALRKLSMNRAQRMGDVARELLQNLE